MSQSEELLTEMKAKMKALEDQVAKEKQQAIVEKKVESIADPTKNWDPAMKVKLFVKGDLSSLSDAELLEYYAAVCNVLGLVAATRPFGIIAFKDGRTELYAKKECTDQLRRIWEINIDIVGKEKDMESGVYCITSRATLPNGRHDESTGAVGIRGSAGTDYANAIMRAETKSKRRVTLSIVGLGGLISEEEARDVPDAKIYDIDNRPPVKTAVKTETKPVNVTVIGNTTTTTKTIDVTPEPVTPAKPDTEEKPIMPNPFGKKKKTTAKADVVTPEPKKDPITEKLQKEFDDISPKEMAAEYAQDHPEDSKVNKP